MSVVPLLLGDSDSLSVSYGMEPEQEHLSKLYSGSGIHSLPELNPKKNYLNSPSAIALIEDAYSEGVIPDTFLNCLEK